MVSSVVIYSGWPLPTSPSSQSPFCHLHAVSVTAFPATFTGSSQLHDNTTTLSPAFATLTDHVIHKSFACHSYRNHPGWGLAVEQASARFPSLQRFTLDPGSSRFTVAPYLIPPILNAPAPTSPASPLKSTFTKCSPAVDSKPLTEALKPVDATLTKILGGGYVGCHDFRPCARDRSSGISPNPSPRNTAADSTTGHGSRIPCAALKAVHTGSTIPCLLIEEAIRYGHC